MVHTIEILESSNSRVQQYRLHLLEQPESALASALLFGGDRWQYVTYIALLVVNDNPVGLASLAPCNEEGNPIPEIIGIWVKQEYRRQGYGVQLLRALSQESVKRFGQVPVVYAVTVTGRRACEAAQRQKIALQILHTGPTIPLEF